jgi:tRNA modification GTPase
VNVHDTIAAIATAPAGALRGVVRISGPAAVSCLQTCFGSRVEPDWPAGSLRRVVPGQLQLPAPLGLVPCDLYLWPDRRSYTRQPSAELHTVGSPPILQAALHAVCAAGARLAAPGEFTLRAFLAGRLDLTQAEAVLGLIDARNRRQFDVALSQLAGGVHAALHQLRAQLLDLLADLEAGLDFAEEDLSFISPDELQGRLSAAAALAARLAEQMRTRSVSSDGFRVVLVGWPNVGKSSLLNALVGERAAIVSELAGTTRDYVTRQTDVLGLNCTLVDTAGAEPGTDPGSLHSLAQALAAAQTQQADVQLFCLDATRPLNDWEHTALAGPQPEHRLVVLTKTDTATAAVRHQDALAVSSHTGAGIDDLRRAIADRALQDLDAEHVVAGTAVRCRDSLRSAADALERAWQAAANRLGEELVAAELRVALDELAQVVGAAATDDILDRVFSRFCIGK